MITLKFLANMFAHDSLEQIAIAACGQILQAVTPLAASMDKRIRINVANIILK